MQYMEVQGKKYPIIDRVERGNGEVVPLLDIKMMSDDEWQRMATEQAIKNFREWYGREPISAEEAFEGQKAYVEKNFVEVPKAGKEGNHGAISIN